MTTFFKCDLCDYKGSEGLMHMRKVHGSPMGQSYGSVTTDKPQTNQVTENKMSHRITINRKIEFDAGHRVYRHESKCNNIHGHRYVVEIECSGELDSLGRVVDFSVIKSIFGKWIDDNLDHGMIVFKDDPIKFELESGALSGHKYFVMDSNPTAENLSEMLYREATAQLKSLGIAVDSITVWETPNCRATYRMG